ncbi:hypothetical protein N1F78_13215 [Seonamhaeicola sp. MEBiC1930]|uniref:hypothetical protein n=1 Tax=Seonamhaeicola sp. MEBiC01930 TaxID=2976768 RepID=UPI0032487B32
MKQKKIFKIIIGSIIFITLPTLLLYAFLYLKYNQDLPNGITGKNADELADKMLNSLNYGAYEKTDTFEWTFKNKRHYVWKKNKGICEVYWKQYKITLDFNDPNNHEASVHSFKVDGELSDELIDKAEKYYLNDSFWVFGPYQVFNKDVKRLLVKTENGDQLLTTHPNGGSYLWQLDENNKPQSFKMWTSELPIDGLEATWTSWTTTKTGVTLPTFHKILLLGIEITDIKGVN